MRHASFFSGVGGLDLGFERAGIKTVSVCEIDPYASSVLAERFPDAPNLGDIVKLAEKELGGSDGKVEIAGRLQPDDERHRAADQVSEVGRRSHRDNLSDWRTADIWSGGFPCQDLSTAGKRAGFAGKRSSLAFTFLDLVERYRPKWLLLENVPGLFSSNKGADFARLLYEMEQLGYSVAWRTLDARYFGVPQRRRRVFIVASLEPDRASEVLFECQGCERHPAPRKSSWQGVASGTSDGSGSNHHGAIADQPSAPPNTDGMREVDGMARGVDNSAISFPSRYSRQPTKFNHQTDPLTLAAGAPAVFRKSSRAQTNEDSETWVEGDVANTINSFDVGDVRTTHAVVGGAGGEDPALPLGLDSHRYRCCGNGVVANVAEWIGHRIIAADQEFQHDRMLAAMDDLSDKAEGLEIPYRDD